MNTEAEQTGWQKVYEQLDGIRQLLQKIETELALSVPDTLKVRTRADKMRAVEIIKGVVASRFDIPLAALCGRRRTEVLVWPRHVAMYLSRELTGLSLETLGGLFQRDHATIRFALISVRDKCSVNSTSRAEVSSMRDFLKTKFDTE